MKLIIIAAVNTKRVIGLKGAMPWHLSEDLKRFKALTTGHTVLMGRKTYESLGRQLPRRRNVVLTSTPIPDVETYASIDEALDKLKHEEKVFVIGGGQIYAQTLALADEILLTRVGNDTEGDTYFPPFEEILHTRFTLASREPHDGFVFEDYIKR